MQSDFAVPERSRVRIACGKKNFRGVVRYCLLHVNACFLGVEFDADSRWSKAAYRPEHLLDPRAVRPGRPAKRPVIM